MAAISAFGVTQHNQIFHFSLEIEFNALRFINYTIPRLCSTYAVATLAILTAVLVHVKVSMSKHPVTLRGAPPPPPPNDRSL